MNSKKIYIQLSRRYDQCYKQAKYVFIFIKTNYYKVLNTIKGYYLYLFYSNKKKKLYQRMTTFMKF